MRVGRNPNGESEVYLTDEETERMKEMVQGASLPLRRMFNQIITKL